MPAPIVARLGRVCLASSFVGFFYGAVRPRSVNLLPERKRQFS